MLIWQRMTAGCVREGEDDLGSLPLDLDVHIGLVLALLTVNFALLKKTWTIKTTNMQT